MIPAWVKLAVAAVLLAALYGFGHHNGAKAVKADWDKEKAVMLAEHDRAEQAARAEEKRRAQQAQAVLEDQVRREALARDRAAAAERAAVGLRNAVAVLNARPAPGNPEAAGYADEARAARELLGECSASYTDLAAEADRRGEQITGLQQWLSHVTQ